MLLSISLVKEELFSLVSIGSQLVVLGERAKWTIFLGACRVISRVVLDSVSLRDRLRGSSNRVAGFKLGYM